MVFQGPNCFAEASPEMLSAIEDTTMSAGFNNHTISVSMGWSGDNSCNYEMVIDCPNSNKLQGLGFNYIGNYLHMLYLQQFDEYFDTYDNSNPYFYSTRDDGFVHFSENAVGNMDANIEYISLDAPPSGVYTVNFAYYGIDPICFDGTVTFLIKYGDEQTTFDFPIQLFDKITFWISEKLSTVNFNTLF